jgi:hypothetical protein
MITSTNIHKIILSRSNNQKWYCNIKKNKNHCTLKKESIGPRSGGFCTVLFSLSHSLGGVTEHPKLYDFTMSYHFLCYCCGDPAISHHYTVSLVPWVNYLLPVLGGQRFASWGCIYSHNGTGFSC